MISDNTSLNDIFSTEFTGYRGRATGKYSASLIAPILV